MSSHYGKSFESCNKKPELSSVKNRELLRVLIKGGIISFPRHSSLIPHVGRVIILRWIITLLISHKDRCLADPFGRSPP